MTKYFVDSGNNYLGGFDGAEAEATLPAGNVEVTIRPGKLHIWNGTQWVSPDTVTVEESKRQRGLRIIGNNGLAKVTFEGLFNHENRIRALEGSPSITKTQLKNAIADLFKKL